MKILIASPVSLRCDNGTCFLFKHYTRSQALLLRSGVLPRLRDSSLFIAWEEGRGDHHMVFRGTEGEESSLTGYKDGT